MAGNLLLAKELLKAEAFRLGFLLSGVMEIAPPDHIENYQRWINDDLHAGMTYLATESACARRANPILLMPQARSVLVVALAHPSPNYFGFRPTSKGYGRVATYAWGMDYHEIIPRLMAALIEAAQAYLKCNIQSRIYTDTGPILERDFARQAGLGWAGKNSCLISPRHGSYFLLGETFLDISIEPDDPFLADYCGTCQRCIQACPTNAIRLDRTINSRRCISYLTIENKGEIPVELRAGIGDWIFGCDVCQMVCPWNLRFAQPGGHAALEPDPTKASPVLIEELSLTPQQFNQRFRHSPILRAKRRGYLRNVAVAIGNQGDPGAVTALERMVSNEPEPLVRSHAAWALGKINTPHARQVLDKALHTETDLTVRAEIVSALT